MSSYRCSQCSTNWPQTGDYQKCPQCEIPCWRSQNVPLSVAEAEGLAKQAAFERYAREWEDKRAVEEENATSVTVRDDRCCLCGARVGSSWCAHPWSRSFDEWPDAMLRQVRELVPYGYDPEPPKRKT